MTREDALRKLVPHGMASNSMVTDAQQFIERLIALDLLKLDEPKTSDDVLVEQLIARGFSKRDANVVLAALDYLQMKIVEK